MNESDIRTALGKRLLSNSLLPPVVWDNKSSSTAIPYLVSDFAPVSVSDRTLSGGDEELSGFWLVSVVSDKDQYDRPSLVIAESIKELFAFGYRMTIPSGLITIRKPTEILKPYEDGPNWRTPVKIHYLAT